MNALSPLTNGLLEVPTIRRRMSFLTDQESECSPGDSVANHCVRTAHIAELVCQILGINTRDAERITTIALLHDIGKQPDIDGPISPVFLSSKVLDEQERTLVKQHPLLSARQIVAMEAEHHMSANAHVDVIDWKHVQAGVISHHEHQDDAYLGADQRKELCIDLGIPRHVAAAGWVLSKYMAPADLIDALRGERAYQIGRPKPDLPEALGKLRLGIKGKHIVKASLRADKMLGYTGDQ